MSRPITRFALILAAVFLGLAAASSPPVAAQERSYARIVRLSYVDGVVHVLRPEETGWQDAVLNLPLRQGYQLATAAGRAEIEFENGAVARMADDSQLRFQELALADGARITQLALTRGTATFYANLSSGDSFSVATPYFTVYVPHSARFRVDVGPDGATSTVLKGDISVDYRGESFRVTKNRSFLFQAVGEQVTLARAPEMDAWDRWVEDRENILTVSRQAALRYTRATVSYGHFDLDFYGGWSRCGYGSGYCWRPYGTSLGWTPYSYGRWIYVSGCGLTWLSYEPWGWLPYHFGTWVWSVNRWLWVPGGPSVWDRWSPSNVYWVNFGKGHWGWGPLAPTDRPGQPPANLPRGTVAPPSGTLGGYSGVDRGRGRAAFERTLPGALTNAKVSFEPPQVLDEEFRNRGRRGATRASDLPAPAGNLPGATSTPAPGYSGTANPAQSRAVSPDEPREPGVRGRIRNDRTPSGIAYDAEDRRYVNNPAAPPASEAPHAPASATTRGYSGTPAPRAPADAPAPPAEFRRPDRNNPASFPGRRDDVGRPSSPAPRYEAYPRQSSPDRMDHSRPAQQPRYEAPRSMPQPAPQPRYESRQPAPMPSAPLPRMEAPRPAPAPAPSAPQSRPEPRERPNRPPHRQ